MEERRKFFRVKLRKLTSVVIQEGAYELIEEAAKSTSVKIYVEDISTGGLFLKSKCEFLQEKPPRIKCCKRVQVSNLKWRSTRRN